MQLKLLVVILIIIASSLEVNCTKDEHDITLSELSPEIQHDLLTFAAGGTNFTHVARGCLGGPPDTRKVKFFYYYKYNVERPIPLHSGNLHYLNPTRPVVIIIHGWLADAEMVGIPTLRDAYLKEDKSNVIVVDWSKLARRPYTVSQCYIPYIAEEVVKFILDACKVNNFELNQVHLVGHSLGAQMSGFIGKSIIQKTGIKIARITGLDPAGPLYQTVPSTKRLCKSDAVFVEVIHSNAGITGYLGHCGTVDYHLNCGTYQPRCITTKSTAPGTLVSTIVCDHLRSMFVWAEAVESDQFKGKSCRRCPGLVLGKCKTDDNMPTFFAMGSPNPPGDNYNVPTHHNTPFAKGCSVYPKEPCV